MEDQNEELLRESACIGNLDEIDNLLSAGVDINSKNGVNGWTALHWASKRGHLQAVKKLMDCGADKTIQNGDGQIPADLTSNNSVRAVLGAPPVEGRDSNNEKSSFKPNYLANPEFLYTKSNHVDISDASKDTHLGHQGFIFQPSHVTCTVGTQWSPAGLVINPDYIILCVRLANMLKSNSDFTEVAIDRKAAPSLEKLTEILCDSIDLGIKPEHVHKIRKLPHTVLRSDKDVLRLTDYQTLEVVLQPHILHPIDGAIVASESAFGQQPDTKYLKEQVSKLVY
uniref:ankyrin repeat domain-containing protein 40-like n=1 Tax=Styela clava TaxID=7725 RepID=UPI0019398FA7|nr:ankyrin repeat domain-containing protein 40-like [Styela clava]